jgi:hypothetical protein
MNADRTDWLTETMFVGLRRILVNRWTHRLGAIATGVSFGLAEHSWRWGFAGFFMYLVFALVLLRVLLFTMALGKHRQGAGRKRAG